MGVDYDANFGVGVKLLLPEEFNGSDDYEEYDFMEEIPKSDLFKFDYFQVGNEYTGYSEGWYLCVKEAFTDGVFNQNVIDLFIKHLKDNKIDYEGNIDLVGGLMVS